MNATATTSRCEVCWLPATETPCSQRCRGLRATKAKVVADRASLIDAIVTGVRKLAPGTTECPGVLAQRILEGRGFRLDARDALLCLRELYFELRRAGRVRFFQKGRVVPPGKDDFRGPFRVAP